MGCPKSADHKLKTTGSRPCFGISFTPLSMLLMLRDSWFKQKKKERMKKKVYLKLLDPTICSHMKERSKKVGGRV